MLKTLSVAAAIAALSFTAPVLAADMPEAAPVIDTSSFNWEGAYIGGFVGFDTAAGGKIGGEIGYNFLPAENFLIGVQASGELAQGSPEFWLEGKAGFVKDNFALYGLSGLGVLFGTPSWKFGVGSEFALADNWTIDGELSVFDPIGAVPTDVALQVGVRYHF